MAASSGLAPSFALKSRVNGVGPAFSSSPLVRFHGDAVVTISGGRSSLTLRRGGASLVNPRCEAAFDNDALIKSIWPSSVSADRYKRERCSIVVIGLCDPCTPVHTREKLAIVESECPRAIEELCKLDHIEEAVVLSTCSRTEIYVLARCQDRGVSEVTNWISKSSGVPISEICKYHVVLYNKDAVEHLLEVSSGLDLGESRIPAQAMQVPEVGRGVMGYGGMIGMLIISAMIVSRRVRTETSIASGAVCVSSAAVDLALMKLSESSSSSSLAMARILVVGAGKMGKLVIQHLVARGCKKMVVVTPREMRVQVISMEMKEDVEIIYKPLCEMYDCTAAADVIFTTTTSKKPLFLKQDVVKLPPGGPGLRLFIDLSFPRNVGSCVASLGTARVYNVDDLKQVVEAAANNEDRLREVVKERSIIVEETEKFQDWRDSLENHLSLEDRRALLEETRIAWLENRLSKFGDDITEVQRKAVEDYSRVLINKQLKNMHASKTRMELEVMKFQGWRDVLKNHLTLEDLRAILESSKFGDDITEPQRKAIGDYCRAWINKRLKNPHEASIIN